MITEQNLFRSSHGIEHTFTLNKHHVVWMLQPIFEAPLWAFKQRTIAAINDNIIFFEIIYLLYVFWALLSPKAVRYKN